MTVAQALKDFFAVLVGGCIGFAAVSAWFAIKSDEPLVALFALLGSAVGLLGATTFALAFLAVANSEN